MAGVSSGSGKTLFSLALMAWLRKLGRDVQPFKVGPDFIDPGHHREITGRVSHNLDGWMLSRDTNREIFLRHSREAEVSIIEGVMGLFDGFSAVSESGSTAEMAKWLGLPVILVADASSMARSAAAMVKGFSEFDPDLTLAGVVFNKVGSSGHAEILEEAVRTVSEVPCLGFLSYEPRLYLPSRHLGLVTAEDSKWDHASLSLLADWVETGLEQDFKEAPQSRAGRQQVSHATQTLDIDFSTRKEGVTKSFASTPARIGVALDAAFCFYYPENLRLLRQAGAELCFFSPLRDEPLPRDLDGLYLIGGYPELYAATLSQGRLLSEVASFAREGGVIYAECGGFMYLMETMVDLEGQSHAMAGIFPLVAVMESRFRALGYREVRVLEEAPIGEKGAIIRGHEFHYSLVQELAGLETQNVYEVRDRRGRNKQALGLRVGNVLGSYIHLHWGSNPHSAEFFVSYCQKRTGSG